MRLEHRLHRAFFAHRTARDGPQGSEGDWDWILMSDCCEWEAQSHQGWH